MPVSPKPPPKEPLIDYRNDVDLPEPTPIDVKSWLQKLLVAILCAVSFYGGWKAHESNVVKQCLANGGQLDNSGQVLLCRLP